MNDNLTNAVVKRDSLNVIRLKIKSGAMLAEQSFKRHVLIVCVKGKGIFTNLKPTELFTND